MVCKKCGTQNPGNAAFCRKCGTKLVTTQNVPVNSVNTGSRTPANVQRRGSRRRQLILSTRRTNLGYLIPNLVVDILIDGGLAGFFFVRGAELYSSYWYRSEGEALQKVATMFFLLGALSAIYHVMVSRTFADVFTDHIAGTGMQGIQCKSFALRFDQISGISTSKGILNIETGACSFLVINTSAGNYKIITTEARANEIMEYYSNAVNR